jgi:oxidoreductase
VGRKPAEGLTSEKLTQHTVDMEKVAEHPELFAGCDYTFCALGTTRAQAGSAEAFRHIDYDLVAEAAKAAKAGGCKHFAYVSSQGASASSWFLYPKTKGEIEEHLKTVGFETLDIYRPGLLARGDKARTVEKIAEWIVPALPVADLATAMRLQAEKELMTSSSASAATTSTTTPKVILHTNAQIVEAAKKEEAGSACAGKSEL